MAKRRSQICLIRGEKIKKRGGGRRGGGGGQKQKNLVKNYLGTVHYEETENSCKFAREKEANKNTLFKISLVNVSHRRLGLLSKAVKRN